MKIALCILGGFALGIGAAIVCVVEDAKRRLRRTAAWAESLNP